MDGKQQASDNQQNDEHFISALKELTAIKDKYIVEHKLQWYEKHLRWPKILFRISGALVIILSVSIPFLTILDGFWKTTVLPLVALVIAALTGLNAFFRWEGDWKRDLQAHIALEHMLSIWEVQITEAKQEPDVQKGIAKVVQATKQLLDNAKDITATETEEAFKLVQFPQSKES